jgi:hypothetical protein
MWTELGGTVGVLTCSGASRNLSIWRVRVAQVIQMLKMCVYGAVSMWDGGGPRG